VVLDDRRRREVRIPPHLAFRITASLERTTIRFGYSRERAYHKVYWDPKGILTFTSESILSNRCAKDGNCCSFVDPFGDRRGNATRAYYRDNKCMYIYMYIYIYIFFFIFLRETRGPIRRNRHPITLDINLTGEVALQNLPHCNFTDLMHVYCNSRHNNIWYSCNFLSK